MSQDTTLLLWPQGKLPNSKKNSLKEKRESTDILRIGLVQEPSIDVYLPAKASATGQAVIICPGGGYESLSYDWEGTDVAKWLNGHGIAGIVLKYRLPDPLSGIKPYKTPLLDAQRAIRLARANAGRWHIKEGSIGIMGFSAGGHLASTAGTLFSHPETGVGDSIDLLNCRPDFMILVYPVITMSKPFRHKGSAVHLLGESHSDSLAREYSTETKITAQTPPALLIHSSDDTAVPVENSLVFYQALKENKVPAEMHIYPYGGHGFGLAIGKGYLQTWTNRCLDWLTSLNK